jgi:hypothetical protein
MSTSMAMSVSMPTRCSIARVGSRKWLAGRGSPRTRPQALQGRVPEQQCSSSASSQEDGLGSLSNTCTCTGRLALLSSACRRCFCADSRSHLPLTPSQWPPRPAFRRSLRPALRRRDVDRPCHDSKQDIWCFTITPTFPRRPLLHHGKRRGHHHALLHQSPGPAPARLAAELYQLRRHERPILRLWRQWLHRGLQEEAQLASRFRQPHVAGLRGGYGGRLRELARLHRRANGPIRRREPEVPRKPEHTAVHTLS